MVTSNKPIQQKIRLQGLSTGDNIGEGLDYKNVNLSKLGYFGGYLKNDIMPKSYDTMLVKALVAFTKMEREKLDEYNLGVRELFPTFDLLDGDGKPFLHNGWVQYYPEDIKQKLHYSNMYFSVYLTDKNSNNDQKIILLYGIQYLSTPVLADTMSIWRKNTKIVELYTLDKYPTVNQVKLFRTPLIINLNDLLDIAFSFQDVDEVKGKSDRIKLLGYVTEQIGRNVM
jgi:hypothetical protein